MKVIAIDFETANERRGSACSVGLAWIEGGAVTRVEERLIRPKEMRFSGFNIGIHGIHPEDVEDASEFPDVMAEFAADFAGATMLAHNASFDMSVWRASLDLYGLPYPCFDYLCTVQMARRVWPELPSHKLNELGRHLCIKFNHHNAAEDAAVCGKVALAITADLGATGIEAVPPLIDMVPGKMYANGYQPCSCGGYIWRRAPARSPVAPDQSPKVQSLAGMTLVFTGILERMSRDEARRAAEALGGNVTSSVSQLTDLVIAGPGAGRKLAQAQKLGVKLIDEETWLKLIGV